MSSFLDLYDSLDIIGNGSFGIIRKVRRKSDGLIFARKELNFDRMSERDRKQIVAEVNILKDLHHDHIVRYHDRHVDRDAGILYILMEYCGGGDLSTIIKQAQKHNRPIPEDTIWGYFMQILLALHHCHHPNGHGRSGSSGTGGGFDADGKERRAQILHRDLKPDNVFLDEANTVKLGDFGLSKALAQASFANTYVGTPYYMSPELMQEKAYDSKSDIWSLGCLIFELCALKPPFHEAKTHAELSILIRNGRIPPLPRGYSQSLSGVIKAMLNINPAMRPSAAQLLQHERLELVFKVAETEKMLSAVKNHKATIVAKEREVLAREASLVEKESHITSLLAQKDTEIASLQDLVTQLQQHAQPQLEPHTLEAQVREAIGKREEELRVAVAKREEEVAVAMARREEEIMEAVRRREAEICEAWRVREEQIRKDIGDEVDERVQWVMKRAEEISQEEERLEGVRVELEDKFRALEDTKELKGKQEKTPLEEVKNLMARATDDTNSHPTPRQQLAPSPHPFPALQTPITRTSSKLINDFIPSAMKGVVLTATGEPLATPTPAELANLFINSPKVGLNFAKIFDFDEAEGTGEDDSGEEVESPPPSPSKRERPRVEKENDRDNSSNTTPTSAVASTSTQSLSTAPPTRLRRPSIRTSSQRPPLTKTSLPPSSSSDLAGPSPSSSHPQPKPLPHPHLQSSSAAPPAAPTRSATLPLPRSHPSPEYDFADEENLPSPFLKRIDRDRVPVGAGATAPRTKRPSSGNLLRAVAAANIAGRRGASISGIGSVSGGTGSASSSLNGAGSSAGGSTRPVVASARKATEEARKALLRP